MATAPTAFTSNLIAALRGNVGNAGSASGLELMANPVVNYAPMPARVALPSRGGLLSPPVLSMPVAAPATQPAPIDAPPMDTPVEPPPAPNIGPMAPFQPEFPDYTEDLWAPDTSVPVMPDEFGETVEPYVPVMPDEFGETLEPFVPVMPDEFGEPLQPELPEQPQEAQTFPVAEQPQLESRDLIDELTPVMPDEFGALLEPEAPALVTPIPSNDALIEQLLTEPAVESIPDEELIQQILPVEPEVPVPDYTEDLGTPIPEPEPELTDQELTEMLLNQMMAEYFLTPSSEYWNTLNPFEIDETVEQ
jgi:hypothetical protein